jgi:hypothetical protein
LPQTFHAVQHCCGALCLRSSACLGCWK